VECYVPGQNQRTKGVINGVSLDITEDELRNILEGARIIDTFRFKGTQNGKRSESRAVLVTVGEETLPQRANLGLLNFAVKSHVWPPLRYYKCQRHGHVAAVCWQIRRSGECGSDLEYSESTPIGKKRQ
jgi:hypothetical protein